MKFRNVFISKQSADPVLAVLEEGDALDRIAAQREVLVGGPRRTAAQAVALRNLSSASRAGVYGGQHREIYSFSPSCYPVSSLKDFFKRLHAQHRSGRTSSQPGQLHGSSFPSPVGGRWHGQSCMRTRVTSTQYALFSARTKPGMFNSRNTT